MLLIIVGPVTLHGNMTLHQMSGLEVAQRA